MKEFPTIERSIWASPEPADFESGIAVRELSLDSLLNWIDAVSFFRLIGAPLPDDEHEILQTLAIHELIKPAAAESWSITNPGAILLANRLEEFHSLKHKAPRLICYQGNDRIQIKQRLTSGRGYASGFEEFINAVFDALSSEDTSEDAGKRPTAGMSELAVRELVTNALMHQDFSKPAAGPLIEVFEDRVEISNSGLPMVDTHRLVNAPSSTRNLKIASLMQEMGLTAGSGCGWQRIVSEAERYQMPAPLVETEGDTTRIVLFASRPLTQMDYLTRIRSVYFHACLKFANREHLTNSSLRDRFDIEHKNSAIASRLIKEAVEANAIAPYQAEIGRKHMRYVPYWAGSDKNSFI